LSDEQLTSVARLADESSDAEWAERAPNCSPVDLRRMVRGQATPTIDESWRRRDARGVWMSWNDAYSMLRFGGQLPDLVGAEFEQTVNELVDQLRPERGGTWDTRAHRGADALALLCRKARRVDHADVADRATCHEPCLAPKANLQARSPGTGRPPSPV